MGGWWEKDGAVWGNRWSELGVKRRGCNHSKTRRALKEPGDTCCYRVQLSGTKASLGSDAELPRVPQGC